MRAIDQAEKTAFGLVQFRYNEPNEFARFTDSLEDETFGATFTSMPALEVQLPENTGTFEEQKLRIIIPREFPDGTDNDFALQISSGEAFYQRTRIDVTEIVRGTEGSQSSSRFIHFVGQVTRAIRNYEGRSGKIAIEALVRKSLLSFASGRMCTNQCQHRLFDDNCGVTFQSQLYPIATINGSEIITGTVPSVSGEFYRRGYLNIDGVRIGIRDYDAAVNPSRFVLIRRPPASWLGRTGSFVPGCDKFIETCRSRWANEDFFMGCGYGMPSYHPVFEDR